MEKSKENLVSLKRQIAKITKSEAQQKELISIAAHQLRAPLTVINGYISMILEDNFGKISSEQGKALDQVYQSGLRLTRLVNNLLSVSRIESGRIRFDMAPAKIVPIVKDAIKELEVSAKVKNLKIVFKKDKQADVSLNIDEAKIRQVVTNLIENSIKYTDKGKVEVSLLKKSKQIVFSVSDKGNGISASDLKKLFKKFSRATSGEATKKEGTGLGLYVCKVIMDAHKGKIWAESKGIGKGAKFSFSLSV
jgi:two-component system NtrC family sensor kinase